MSALATEAVPEKPSRSLLQRNCRPPRMNERSSSTSTQALSVSVITGRTAPVRASAINNSSRFWCRFRRCTRSSVGLSAHSIRAR